MTKLFGKISNFLEICKLVKLEGKDPTGSTSRLISNFLMDCGTNEIKVTTLNQESTVLTKLTYKKIDVINRGEIPIGSIEEFESYLKRFNPNDEVYVEDEENKLKITRLKPKKIAKIPLTVRENIEDSLRVGDIGDRLVVVDDHYRIGSTELPVIVKTRVEFIKQVLDDGNIKNLERKYPFTITKDVFEGKVGDEKGGMIVTEIPTTEIKCESKTVSAYRMGIDNVFHNLQGEVKICLAQNAPMAVEQKTDNYEVVYLISPLEGE